MRLLFRIVEPDEWRACEIGRTNWALSRLSTPPEYWTLRAGRKL